MVDLNELQIFVQVSKTQSFTKAAKRLGLPKSGVSRSVLKLEVRLGVRLVERTTRSVALTEAGELYLERCQRVLEEAEQADLVIGALQAKPRGTLRVGAPVPFARGILAPILGEFLALYPDLRLHLQLLSTESTLRDKDLDVVIRAGPLEDSGLLARPLMQVRLGAFASPQYLAGRDPLESPADLRQHACLTTNCGSHGEPADNALWRLRRGAERQEVRVEARVAVPDPTIVHQLTLSGVGVALLSLVAARRDLAEGRLVRALPEWEPDPVELHAVYPSPLSSSPKVRAFLQFLKEHFAERREVRH